MLTAGAVGLISWLTTLSAVTSADDGATGLERLLLLAYPSSDVLLIVLTVLLLTRAGGNRNALHLVGAGVVALGISDSAFAYLGALGLYDGGLIDLGWIGGFLLIALAGTCREPAARTGRRLADGSADAVRVPASVLPYVPVLVALFVVAAVTLFARPLSTSETMVACGIVLSLLARQYLSVLDNSRLVQELATREQQLRRQPKGQYSTAPTGTNINNFLERLARG